MSGYDVAVSYLTMCMCVCMYVCVCYQSSEPICIARYLASFLHVAVVCWRPNCEIVENGGPKLD